MNRRQFIPMVLAPAFAGWKPMEGAAPGLDWPQWRGPERTGLSTETGLLPGWAPSGPKQIWAISDLGAGYGSVAVVGDSLYVQGTRGDASVVWKLNRADGKTIWGAALGPWLEQDRGPGPRGTPTVVGDQLWALTENGDLACIRSKDGSIVWKKNILQDYGGSNPKWRISESPLIDGNKVIVTPGGSGGIVALDKATGKEIWAAKELHDGAGYSSCIAINVDGVRCYTTLTAQAAVGVRANDGKLLWRYERVANRTANIATPIFHNNRVFYSTAYDTGCALLRLKGSDGKVVADEVYFNRDMMNHHGGLVLVNGNLYGFSNAILTCMDFETGAVKWRNRSVGKGCVTYADGKLFLLGENHVAGLASASPEAYHELGRFNIPDQGLPSWSHPVVAGGQLFMRNQGMLMCYNVRAT